MKNINSKNNTKKKNQNGKLKTRNEQFLKRDIALIDYVLIAFTSIISIIAAYLLSVNRINEGLACSVSAVLLTLLGICLHIRHRFLGKKKVSHGLMFVFGFPAAILVAYTIFSVSSVKKEDRFLITANTPFIVNSNNSSEETTRIFKLNIANNTATITRIPIFVYLTIKNTQKVATTITGMFLEGARENTWVKLCRVDLGTGSLFEVITPPYANRIDDSNALDILIPNTRSIQPGESVSGWSAWSCPEPGMCVFPALRVTINEVGESSSLIVASSDNGNNLTRRSIKYTEERINLYQLPHKFSESCEQKP